MTIDEAQLQTEFDQAVWTKPEVEGAAPLSEKKFLTPREYKEFLVHRFKVREDVKRNPGETNASYIDRTNKEALDRTYAGHGLKKTFYTDSVLFKAISTPGKRILRSGVPLAQRYFVLMNGNASLPSDRNTSGQGLQSIYQRQALHTARGDKALNSLRKFYDKDMGKLSEAPFIGVTYDKARAIIPGNISFDDWVSTAFEKYIAYSKIIKEPEQVAKLSDNDKQTIQLLKDFFQSYRQDAEDVGLFKSVKSINEDIEALGLKLEKKNELIDDIDRKGQQKGYTEKQQRLKKSLQKEVLQIEGEIKFLETLKDEGLDRTDFYFPIYYDKKALLADEGLRQELVDVFTQHITENKDRFRFLWDEKTGQRVERNPDQTPADIAEGIVNHILKEDIDDIDYSGLPSGKHFRHRSVNIPEWKVSKFIIKRPEVLSSYSRRMGNRLEWVRNFGKQSIDDILNEVELDAIAKNKSDQDIANLRADMLGEYERLMGILSKSPDRVDAQVVKATKDLAGMTFLHSAGIASITDAGSIILEHGIGKVFNDAVLKSGTKGFQLAAAEVKKITVGADIIQGHGIRRVVNDDVRRINPNTVERIFNPITNAFYNIPIIGNSLGVVTRFGKIIDAVLRQNHLIDLSKRYDSLDIMDIEYLARYGIDRDTARQFADLIDNEVIQQVDGFYLSNIDKWPSATVQDRDLIRKFETAMNSGTANTIMHATGFDKPLMMDGVMYVNHKPWMDALGFKIDKRASTKNIKKVRLESQVMTMPFQFMNFALAANNRITGAMMDPHRKYRIQSVISLMALSYISLQLKKPDWWFENKSNTEIFMRTVDASGVLGVYSDIGYMGLHMLIGSGVYDQEEGVIQGKYRPTPFAAFTEPLGAGPGLIADWTIGLKDLFDGGDTEAAERLKYLLPIWPLFGLREDMQDAAGALITGK